MASRKPYECFRCRDNGFPNVMVYLAGKDDQGKTIYIEEDGTGHVHKQGQEQLEHEQRVTAASMPLLRLMDAKLDRIIALLEKSTTTTKTSQQ